MLEPRYHNLPMLGLGYSVGTGPNGIKADVVVVKSFDELEKRASEVFFLSYKLKTKHFLMDLMCYEIRKMNTHMI